MSLPETSYSTAAKNEKNQTQLNQKKMSFKMLYEDYCDP